MVVAVRAEERPLAVYHVIVEHWRAHFCSPSTRVIAHAIGHSVSTVNAITRQLVDADIIRPMENGIGWRPTALRIAIEGEAAA